MFVYKCIMCDKETSKLDVRHKVLHIGVMIYLKCPNCGSEESINVFFYKDEGFDH